MILKCGENVNIGTLANPPAYLNYVTLFVVLPTYLTVNFLLISVT